MKVLFKSIFLHVFLGFLLVSCGSRSASSPSTDAITKVVDAFGKRLQSVSLLSPDVGEEMTREYSDFISPRLLEEWMSDLDLAPGRKVSSPWPDRIEVISISEISKGKYEVIGEIIEVTSSELASGGVANTIPMQITVESFDGSWLITELVMGKNVKIQEKEETIISIVIGELQAG